jgi:iduronate 2-sulfatase
MPEQGPLTQEQSIHLIHGYHAATSYMDAQLGKVLDALDASGLASNTIIVFWGDHGWHLGDHGMWCKHTNYEQAARIPVLVVAPGIQPARTQALIESCDIYPTLAELAQLPAPPQGDGRSFASVLKDPATTVRDHAIHVYPRGAGLIGRAIRTQRHRLVEWKKPGAAPDTAILELYDYEADPAETKNLAAEQPAVVAVLRQFLVQHPEAKPQIASKPEAAPKKPAPDRGKMFDQRDKDKDGQLTKEEFLLNQPDPEEAPKRFPKFDTDGNGTLSRDEFIKGGKK